MNLSLSATGTRTDVLKYLQSVSSTGTPPPPPPPPPTDDAAKVAEQSIIDALTKYVQAAPEGSDVFTLQVGVYVGWQAPASVTPSQNA